MSLKNKTIVVSGGSRGIGLAIALRAARDGANIVVAAKTADPHPVLPGTIFTAATEIEAAGGRALPVVCDVRDDAQIQSVVEKTIATFGGIDALVLNASALNLQGTLDISTKKFDLMSDINQRGTFLMGRACLPHLIEAENPHILTISTAAGILGSLVGRSSSVDDDEIFDEPMCSRLGAGIQKKRALRRMHCGRERRYQRRLRSCWATKFSPIRANRKSWRTQLIGS